MKFSRYFKQKKDAHHKVCYLNSSLEMMINNGNKMYSCNCLIDSFSVSMIRSFSFANFSKEGVFSSSTQIGLNFEKSPIPEDRKSPTTRSRKNFVRILCNALTLNENARVSSVTFAYNYIAGCQ